MANTVTIAWVRRRRGDSSAADFGIEFGKAADIEEVSVEHDKCLNAAKLTAEHKAKLASARKLVMAVCGLAPHSIVRFIRAYAPDWGTEFVEKNKPKKRRGRQPLQKRRRPRATTADRELHGIVERLDTKERITVVLAAIGAAPDGTFAICEHSIDPESVETVRSGRYSCRCIKCGMTGGFYAIWQDEEEDEEEDEFEDEEEDDEEDEYE